MIDLASGSPGRARASIRSATQAGSVSTVSGTASCDGRREWIPSLPAFARRRQGEPIVQIRGASRGIGSLRKIVAQVGDRVEAGKPVIYIESTKMEIPVLSDDGGRVREVLVAENELVVAILED